MEVSSSSFPASIRFCNRRVKCSFAPRPSSLPLCAHRGQALRWSPGYMAISSSSVNSTRTSFVCNQSKCLAASLCHSFKEFSGQRYKYCFPKRERPVRDTVVRSELLGTGMADAAYPLAEVKLGSKVRGVCFYIVTAIAAIFIIVPMFLQHPLVLLFDRYRRRAHYLAAKIWATLSVSPFLKIEVEGLENLPPCDIPAVYVSNHQSFMDIYTLLTLGRSFKLISKTSIFLYPVIGWAMSLMGVIPLKRMDSKSQVDCLKRCIDLVKKGSSVFFFPEGTRSKDGKLGTFKKGAFSIAAKTGVPVVPITLIGTGEIMPAGKEGIINSGSVKVVIHKLIEGNDAEVLCQEARKTIAAVLDRQTRAL